MVESKADSSSVGTTTTQTTDAPKEPFTFKKLSREDIIQIQQEKVLAQSELAPQTLEDFDVKKVTPLNPEIISRQATINIGTIGHVAHGKSTLVRSISEQKVSLFYSLLTFECIDCSSQTRACS